MYLEIFQNWKLQCIEELLSVEWISHPQNGKYLQNVYHVIEWYKEFLKNYSSKRATEKLILECWTHLNKHIFKEDIQMASIHRKIFVFVVQSLSHIQLFANPWTAACQDLLSFTVSQNLFKLMSTELAMLSNHWPPSLCCPLLLLPSIFPSIRIFSNESVLHTRYWSFSFSTSPSNGYSGLISFRIGRLDLLAVQGTRKSLPQHHNSMTSILWLRFLYSPTHIHTWLLDKL